MLSREAKRRDRIANKRTARHLDGRRLNAVAIYGHRFPSALHPDKPLVERERGLGEQFFHSLFAAAVRVKERDRAVTSESNCFLD
jgi:hypothetical protein